MFGWPADLTRRRAIDSLHGGRRGAEQRRNGRILREGPYDALWIQPAAGDAGGALGAALFAWHQISGHPRDNRDRDTMRGALLGPEYTNEEIGAYLARVGAPAERLSDSALVDRVARLLAEEKVVGWFHGRMEFGPRALGARSIIGDARSPRMQAVMNKKIKFREGFRPFAPCVLSDHVKEYFDLACESPYMLLVARVAEDNPADAVRFTSLWGIDGSTCPGARSGSHPHRLRARIQTVDPERHGCSTR